MYDTVTRKLLKAVHTRFVGLDHRNFKVGKYMFEVSSRDVIPSPNANLEKDKTTIWIRTTQGFKGSCPIVGTIQIKVMGGNVHTCVVDYQGGNMHLGESPTVIKQFAKAVLTHVMNYANANPHHIKYGLTPVASQLMKAFSKKMGDKS